MSYKIIAGKSVTLSLSEDGDNVTVSGEKDEVVVIIEVGDEQQIMHLTIEQAQKLYDAFGNIVEWES